MSSGHDGYLNVEVVKEEGVIYIRGAEALEQLHTAFVSLLSPNVV